METVGKAATMEEFRQPGVSLVLTGGDAGVHAVWGGVLVTVGCDDKGVLEYPCGVTMIDHWEAGKTESRKVMGDTVGQGDAMGGRDAVVGHVHSPSASEGSTVGGPTNTIGVLNAGNQL